MRTAVVCSRINAGGYLQPEASPCPGATRASGLRVVRCNPLLPHRCAAAGGLEALAAALHTGAMELAGGTCRPQGLGTLAEA